MLELGVDEFRRLAAKIDQYMRRRMTKISAVLAYTPEFERTMLRERTPHTQEKRNAPFWGSLKRVLRADLAVLHRIQ